jgi:hypothetical protein
VQAYNNKARNVLHCHWSLLSCLMCVSFITICLCVQVGVIEQRMFLCCHCHLFLFNFFKWMSPTSGMYWSYVLVFYIFRCFHFVVCVQVSIMVLMNVCVFMCVEAQNDEWKTFLCLEKNSKKGKHIFKKDKKNAQRWK